MKDLIFENTLEENSVFTKQGKRLELEFDWVMEIVDRWKDEEKALILEYEMLKIDFDNNHKDIEIISKVLTNVHYSIEFWVDYANGIVELFEENEKNHNNFKKARSL